MVVKLSIYRMISDFSWEPHMNIRLTPLLPSQVVGKITSRVKKECIESDAEEAQAEGNNLAVPVDTDKGNFDKKKAKNAETAVYGEEDETEKDVKKTPASKKLHEERWDKDYDRDDDNQAYYDREDAADRKRDRDEETSDSWADGLDKKKTENRMSLGSMIRELNEEELSDDENESDDDYNLNLQGVGYSKDKGGHKRKTGTWKTKSGKTASRTTIDGQIRYSEEIEPETAKMVSSNEGVSMPMFREMMKNTERALNLREAPKSLTKGDLRGLVKEEYVKILDEQHKGAVKIEKKLYELREDLITQMFKRTSTTKESLGRPPMVKTLQLSTVSNLIDVPVNELTLYFLNNVKSNDNHHLIEYHLGHVYFYGN